MHDHDGNDQTGAQRVRFFQYQAGSGRLLKNVRQSWSNSTPDKYWFDVKFWTNIKAGQVYPKYQVIPDILGYLITNDYQNESGHVGYGKKRRIADEYRVPVGPWP